MKNVSKEMEIAKIMLESVPKEKRLASLTDLRDLGFLPMKEYSVQEIAYLTGYSRTTINAILNTALAKMKNYMEKNNIEL